MRQQFKSDEKAHKRKMQAFQDGQQHQAQLVQKMQNKVSDITSASCACDRILLMELIRIELIGALCCSSSLIWKILC